MPIQKITSGIIQDGAIVAADIVSIANTQITGNIVSSQITSVANTQITGNIAATTATTATNLAGGSNGTIPYQSANGTTQMLAVGTSGQLLQTNGAGAPSWVTASAGALTLLSTVNAAGSATVDIETTFNSTYDNYMIVASGITCVTNGILKGKFKLGGSYGGSYDFHVTNQSDSSTSYSALAAEAVVNFTVLDNLDSGASSTAGFVMYVYKPSSTTLKKQATWTGGVNRNNVGSSVVLCTGAVGVAESTALTGVQFFMASGNITLGTFRLYGIANS
jgi:hypothetical protein